ncbi:SPW repeat protein [Methylobacterium sp. WCS2018Hpa-22]|uniref:SPW repeat protein n=1 Tax=Methylobacterium sp. WCS2018Hpa-22 TaxID=3073633 RepID=UPI002889051D|nr:SPW repeat protein [Methylobacterium sp. WCS2018Hpa-22]
MARSQLHARPSLSGWRTDQILLGALQHASGAALVLAAWVLLLIDQGRPGASALLPGMLIFGLSAANQLRFRAVLERAVALTGAWTLLAPWMLGFATNDVATWAHVTLGGLTLASALAWLNLGRKP